MPIQHPSAVSPAESPVERSAQAYLARLLAAFEEPRPEDFGCPEVLLSPLRETWEDPPGAVAARRGWPALRTDAEPGAVAEVARIARVPAEVVRLALDFGALRFARIGNAAAFVLRSGCGRYAEAWRLDGAPWLLASGFTVSRPLPGSAERVPLGLGTVGHRTRALAVAAPSSAFLPVLAGMVAEDRLDCGLVVFPGPGFRFCRETVAAVAGRRVRLFVPEGRRWTRTAAGWAAVMQAAGCEVDCFDFAAFGVRDAAGFAALPEEEKEVELMPE